MKTDQLELKELDNFIGTEKYYNINGVNVTDGVYYVMENGYSWFITDSVVILLSKFKSQDFIVIDLQRKDKKAKVVYSDGNGKVLHIQEYEYTDAKKVKLYFCNNVLMLSGEY